MIFIFFLKAKEEKEDAVEQALDQATAEHNSFLEDLKKKHEKELKVWSHLLPFLIDQIFSCRNVQLWN